MAAVASTTLYSCGSMGMEHRLDRRPRTTGSLSAPAIVFAASRNASRQVIRATPAPPVLLLHDVQFAADISDVGSRSPSVLFYTTTYAVRVWPSSRAIVRASPETRPRFARPVDEANWRATGGRVPIARPASSVMRLAPGQFSFVPQGAPFTYREARLLRASKIGVRRAVYAHLRSMYGPSPPDAVLLRAYGFLLARAPLSPSVRAAVFADIASLPGIRVCGSATDLLGRHGVSLCAVDSEFRVDLLVAPSTGAILSVEERIRQRSALFAGLPAGSLVESDAFSSAPSP
jgi:hypothetical protein